MRTAAWVLVLFGALVLGWWGLIAPARGQHGREGAADATGLLSPVAGGIALVCGLLGLVGSRRTENGTT
jgi:hypothetical protein